MVKTVNDFKKFIKLYVLRKVAVNKDGGAYLAVVKSK